MAFGDTATLQDDFNRANENPLDSGSYADTDPAMKIVSNQAVGHNSDFNFATYLTVANNADGEAYITVATHTSTNNEEVDVGARIKDEGGSATWDGYVAQLRFRTGTDQWRVYRVDDGVYTQLGGHQSVDLSAGDKIGIEVAGTAISAYHFTGGSWNQRANSTDSTYSAAGKFGFGVDGTTYELDDFFAGPFAAAGNPYYYYRQN